MVTPQHAEEDQQPAQKEGRQEYEWIAGYSS